MVFRTYTEYDTYVDNKITSGKDSISYLDVRDALKASTEKTKYEFGLKRFSPKEYGAYADGESASKGASYDVATKTLTIIYFNGSQRVGTSEDIGKIVGYGGQESTVASIDGSGNIVTTDTLESNNVMWYLGHDDTVAINNTINAAIDAGGGCVDLGTDAYLVSNSAEDYAGGKTAAIYIDKPSGVPLTIQGSASMYETAIIARWNQKISGDAIGNVHNQATDFLTLKNFTVTGVGFAKGSLANTRESGIRFLNATSGFVKTDSFITIKNVKVDNFNSHGIYYTGRGEMHIIECRVGTIKEYGIYLKDTFDNKVINNTITGTGKTGLRIENSNSTNVTGGKIYYIGDLGGNSCADSAAIAIVAGQWRGGNIQFSDINTQEIRGSTIYIENSGDISFTNIMSAGAGRETINQVNLPSIIADVHIVGGDSIGIRLNGIWSTGFPIYADQKNDNGDSIHYHGNKTHMVYIEGATTGTGDDLVERLYGPEKISGELHYMEQTVDSNFNLEYGPILTNTRHGAAVIPFGGDGCSNGRNTGLKINGVSCT